jgi:hypothetical protein
MFQGSVQMPSSGKAIYIAGLLPDSRGNSPSTHFGGDNPFGRLFNKCVVVPLTPSPLEKVLGLDWQPQISDLYDYRYAPELLLYQDFEDFRRYSTPMSLGLSLLVKGISAYRAVHTRSVKGEHSVTHPTCFGSVIDGDTIPLCFQYNSTFTLGGISFPLSTNMGLHYNFDSDGVTITSFGTLLGGSYVLLPTAFETLLEELEDPEDVWTTNASYSVGSKTFNNRWDISFIRDVLYDTDGNPVSFVYDYRYRVDETTSGLPEYNRFHHDETGTHLFSISIDVRATKGGTYPAVTVESFQRMDVRTSWINLGVRTFRQKDESDSWGPWQTGQPSERAFEFTSRLVNDTLIDVQSMNGKLNSIHGSPWLPAQGGTLLASINAWVDDHMDDFRPGSFYSTYDAVQPLIELMSNNFLEDLANLGGVGQYLPDIALLLRSLKELKKGNIGSGTKHVVDFLTSAELLVDFNIAPDLDTAQELISNFRPLLEALDRIDVLRGTYHGKHSVDLDPDFFPFSDLANITIRTKAVIDFRESAIWSMIFGAEAAGLLPRLGNLWDLVPFSFVVDWFYNVGARLDSVDHSVFMAAFNVRYLVHSFDIVGVVPNSKLSLHGLVANPSGVGTPGFRVYRREVSKYIPALRGSRVDFQTAGPLRIRTAGSLLWQVVT